MENERKHSRPPRTGAATDAVRIALPPSREPRRRERQHVLRFEGNAQVFRIHTRLEQTWRGGGLSLTHARRGAFMKYPCTAEGAGRGSAAPGGREDGNMAGG